VDVRFNEKRPKATDIHKALADWFPSGYSQSKPDFLAAVAKATAGARPWGELGKVLLSEEMEVEGAPTLTVRQVNLAAAPAWFKVRGGTGGGRNAVGGGCVWSSVCSL
jgi:hypothetical protein